MNTMQCLFNAVRAGSHPVVTFHTSAIEDLEGYPEKGMRARVVGCATKRDDMMALTFDFSEFETHNAPFESANYFDKAGHATLTARENGAYKPQESFYVMADDLVARLMLLESDARMGIFNDYTASGSAQTYVQWLEDHMIAAAMVAA